MEWKETSSSCIIYHPLFSNITKRGEASDRQKKLLLQDSKRTWNLQKELPSFLSPLFLRFECVENSKRNHVRELQLLGRRNSPVSKRYETLRMLQKAAESDDGRKENQEQIIFRHLFGDVCCWRMDSTSGYFLCFDEQSSSTGEATSKTSSLHDIMMIGGEKKRREKVISRQTDNRRVKGKWPESTFDSHRRWENCFWSCDSSQTSSVIILMLRESRWLWWWWKKEEQDTHRHKPNLIPVFLETESNCSIFSSLISSLMSSRHLPPLFSQQMFSHQLLCGLFPSRSSGYPFNSISLSCLSSFLFTTHAAQNYLSLTLAYLVSQTNLCYRLPFFQNLLFFEKYLLLVFVSWFMFMRFDGTKWIEKKKRQGDLAVATKGRNEGNEKRIIHSPTWVTCNMRKNSIISQRQEDAGLDTSISSRQNLVIDEKWCSKYFWLDSSQYQLVRKSFASFHLLLLILYQPLFSSLSPSPPLITFLSTRIHNINTDKNP